MVELLVLLHCSNDEMMPNYSKLTAGCRVSKWLSMSSGRWPAGSGGASTNTGILILDLNSSVPILRIPLQA